MEQFNGRLCATYDDLAGLLTRDQLVHKVQRGKITQMQIGGNGRVALFAVDTLPLKCQTELYRREPDMKERAESKPFVDTIEPDGAAVNFYETYLLADGRCLSPDKVAEYSNNAAILNAYRVMLEKANSQRKRQSKGGLNKTEFWNRAAAALGHIADRYPHTLPENPRRLQEKFNLYLRGGYETLISGRFGLKNAARVDTDVKEAMVIYLMSDPRNFADTQIADYYNTIANEVGWASITSRTVTELRQKHDLQTSGGRLGATRFRNQRTMQVKRTRPTVPLQYWTTDGWVAELLYQNVVERKKKDGSISRVTTYTNRLTLVVVLDVCNNYPIGYAIGDKENPELIKAAMRNAINHVAELFGERYCVNQLQSDNYGRGHMTPAYKSITEAYTPAKAHNAKAKVIEPWFNYFNRKHCQPFENWGGFGITSNKNLQPNSEFLNKNRRKFPTKDECYQQLASLVEKERAEKREEYVRLFDNVPLHRRIPLSEERYLLTCGAETGRRNALEGTGLILTIDGKKYTYDSFDAHFREYAHVKWTIKYDPENMDKALAVSEDGTRRFMLERKYEQPMALADRKDGDAAQLERVLTYNKQLEQRLEDKHVKIHNTLEQFFNDNPQLDVATRLLVCDSKGQNKDNKQTRRLQSCDITDIEAVEVRAVQPAVEVPFDDDDEFYKYL